MHSKNILILKWNTKSLPDCVISCSRWPQRMCTWCILDFDDERRLVWKTICLPQMSRCLTCSNLSTGIVERWPIQQINRCIHTLTAGRFYSLCTTQVSAISPQKCTLCSKERESDGWWPHEYKRKSVFLHTQRSWKHKRKRTWSRIVFQGVVCCIVTCFSCSVGTQFPLYRIQRKNLGVCKHRKNKEGERQAGKECENSRVT